jgi:hypothetical protein
VPIRRTLVAVVTAAWLLPAATAWGVALHVAFDHSAGHESEAAPAATALAKEETRQRLDETNDAPHEHALVEAPSDVAVRRGFDGSSRESPAAASVAAFAPRVDTVGVEFVARARFVPPRTSGPPLLARLSTLRI